MVGSPVTFHRALLSPCRTCTFLTLSFDRVSLSGSPQRSSARNRPARLRRRWEVAGARAQRETTLRRKAVNNPVAPGDLWIGDKMLEPDSAAADPLGTVRGGGGDLAKARIPLSPDGSGAR